MKPFLGILLTRTKQNKTSMAKSNKTSMKDGATDIKASTTVFIYTLTTTCSLCGKKCKSEEKNKIKLWKRLHNKVCEYK